MSLRYTSDDYHLTEIAEPEHRRLNGVHTRYDYHVYGLAGRPERKHVKLIVPRNFSVDGLTALLTASNITFEVVFDETIMSELIIGLRKDVRENITYGNAMLRMIVTFLEGKLTIPEGFRIPPVPGDIGTPPAAPAAPAPTPRQASSSDNEDCTPDELECDCNTCREARGLDPLSGGEDDCEAPPCNEDNDDLSDAGDDETI
jgi:hypothetical protein